MIGSMRDRIIIKAPTDMEVPGAGAVSTYDTILEDWCNVQPLSSSRVLQDNQNNLNDANIFNIRWRTSPQIDKTMIIVYEDREYTINSIIEVKERARFWKITAVTDAIQTVS